MECCQERKKGIAYKLWLGHAANKVMAGEKNNGVKNVYLKALKEIDAISKKSCYRLCHEKQAK